MRNQILVEVQAVTYGSTCLTHSDILVSDADVEGAPRTRCCLAQSTPHGDLFIESNEPIHLEGLTAASPRCSVNELMTFRYTAKKGAWRLAKLPNRDVSKESAKVRPDEDSRPR